MNKIKEKMEILVEALENEDIDKSKEIAKEINDYIFTQVDYPEIYLKHIEDDI